MRTKPSENSRLFISRNYHAETRLLSHSCVIYLYGLWGRKLAEGFLEMSIELMGLFLWRVRFFFFIRTQSSLHHEWL
jgi:hypothetical protein